MAEHPTVGRRHLLRLHHHTTLDMTPLDDWSSLPRDLYLTKFNIHKRQTPWPGGIWTYCPSKRMTADWPSTDWTMSLSRGVVRETEQTWTGLMRDLYHAQHYCSTILSYTADCCGHYKWIRIVICFLPTFHILPAVSWLRWWLYPAVLSM